MEEHILCLDPSSTATGWARLTVGGTLIDHGLVKPPAKWRFLRRIDAMLAVLEDLAAQQPSVVVVEVPEGKVHRGRHRGGGAGLSTLGQAAGAMWAWLQARGVDVDRVLESEWTRSIAKGTRAQVVASIFPGQYRIEDDPDLDVADAIGIGLWWLDRRRLLAVGAVADSMAGRRPKAS